MTDSTNFDYFELRRLSDNLVYQFDRKPGANGEIGYQRRDRDLWIVRKSDLGWVAFDEGSRELQGRPWNVLPQDQGDHPPAGEWVSKKGPRSYVYKLVYCTPPAQENDDAWVMTSIIASGDVAVDGALEALVDTVENRLPNHIYSYYLEGGHADRTALTTIDVE